MRGQRRAARLLALLAWSLLVGCSTPIFAVDEAVRFEDGFARMVAFSQNKSGWILRGIEDVEVQFLVDGQEVARSVTDKRGFAKAIASVPEAESFEAVAQFDGQSFDAGARLFAWRTDRVVVACDIDATISQTNLSALFFRSSDASKPIEGSPRALHVLDEDFQILYVTARPRFTLGKTMTWLEEHGYPLGPVVTSLTVRDALGQTRYKKRTLTSLRKYYGNLLIGIGNTDIDAGSYGTHGMLTVLVQPKKPMGRDENLFRFQDWEQVGAFFRMNREVLSDPARVRAALAGDEKLMLPEASEPAGG